VKFAVYSCPAVATGSGEVVPIVSAEFTGKVKVCCVWVDVAASLRVTTNVIGPDAAEEPVKTPD
jgi:hypothetical protein